MAHIYNGILLSHKKKRNGVCSEVDVVRWMELESVIQSEVRDRKSTRLNSSH